MILYPIKITLAFVGLLAVSACELIGFPGSSKKNAGIKTYSLLGDATTPEGISVDTRNGRIYTGSLQDGSMQVTVNGQSRYFIEPGSGALLPNVLGSKVDEKHNRLWVCSNDFSKTFNGTPTARISVLNLPDGRLLKQFTEADLAGESVYPFVNDLVLDKRGNAYISNSGSNTIFNIPTDLSPVQVLAKAFPAPPAGKKYSLNGIALSADERYLIANTFIMAEADAAALFRINVGTGAVDLIPFQETGTTDFSRSGGDGLLMLDKGTLLCVSVASTLLKVTLDKDLTQAIITNISHGTAAQPAMIGCATIARYQDNLFTTNAQGMALFNPQVVAQKPYKIIEIPKGVVGL